MKRHHVSGETAGSNLHPQDGRTDFSDTMVPLYQTTWRHTHYDYNITTHQPVDLFPTTRSMVPIIHTENKYSETYLQQKRKGPKFFFSVSVSFPFTQVLEV